MTSIARLEVEQAVGKAEARRLHRAVSHWKYRAIPVKLKGQPTRYLYPMRFGQRTTVNNPTPRVGYQLRLYNQRLTGDSNPWRPLRTIILPGHIYSPAMADAQAWLALSLWLTPPRRLQEWLQTHSCMTVLHQEGGESP